jgi:hypothetical protein
MKYHKGSFCVHTSIFCQEGYCPECEICKKIKSAIMPASRRLPDGSVRALLAIAILAFVIWATVTKSTYTLPSWAIGILGTVVGFYFGSNAVASALQQPKQSFTITTNVLPEGTVGKDYKANLAASGGKSPYAWSNKPDLPQGLQLNKNTGSITGTPSKSVDNVEITFEATDNSGATATKSLTIAIK